MSRKPAAGSLEAAALSLAQEVSGNPDDWERRRSALFATQQAVDAAGKALPEAGGGEKAVFTPEVWRYLKEPLKHTLNDLRSAIVKEACVLLEKLSSVAGNYMAALMRDMLNVLLQLLANGNSVIVGQVDSCMRHIIAHSRFPRQLKEVEYTVRNSRSKDLRESVGSYVLLMLKTWPAASMDKEAGYLESIVQLLLRDASSAARTDARASFGILMEHWPKRANKVLQAAEPRTAKSLREQYGIGEAGITAAASSSSLSSLAATTTAGSSGGGGAGGRGGGAPRVSKAAGAAAPGGGGTANAKGSRRGPSSAEALRASESSSGNGPRSNPPLSPNRQRRAKAVAATAARGGAKRAPSIPSSSSTTPPPPPPGVHRGSSPSTSASTSSLAAAAARRRRNGLVPGSAGAPSSSPAATAAAAEAKSPSMAAAKTANARKRRPANTPTSTSSSSAAAAAASTARSATPRTSSGSTSGTTSAAKAKANKPRRLSSSSAASASASEGAPAPAGVRPLVISSASTTPTGSSSKPGAAMSSPLLVSPDGFMAAPGGPGVAKGHRASGGGGGGSQGGAASSAAGSSVGLGEGATATSLVEGDKVRFQGDTQRTGVVRYVGETQFATGVWVGVELPPNAEPPGLNDGSVNGVSYFTCPPACGVFAKPDMFDLIGEKESAGGHADDGRAAGGSEKAYASAKASLAGAELLRFHKMFANEALEALKDEMALLPGLESLVESEQAVPTDRVRLYLEILESAAEAREAAAARLRAQIRQTTGRYPSVFSASPPSPPTAAAAAAAERAGGVLGAVGAGADPAIEGGDDGERGTDDKEEEEEGDDEEEEEEEEEDEPSSGGAGAREKGGDAEDEGGGEGRGGGGGGGGGDSDGDDNDTGVASGDGSIDKGKGEGEEEAAASERQGEAQGQQQDGDGDGEESLRDYGDDAESGAADDVDLVAEEGEGRGAAETAAVGGTASGKQEGGGGRGSRRSNGPNVFGIAGKFLRDVLHIPPGEDGTAAAAAAAAAPAEGVNLQGAGGEGGAVDTTPPPTAAGVDLTSPTTPNAIAADGKTDAGGNEGIRGGSEKSRGDVCGETAGGVAAVEGGVVGGA